MAIQYIQIRQVFTSRLVSIFFFFFLYYASTCWEDFILRLCWSRLENLWTINRFDLQYNTKNYSQTIWSCLHTYSATIIIIIIIMTMMFSRLLFISRCVYKMWRLNGALVALGMFLFFVDHHFLSNYCLFCFLSSDQLRFGFLSTSIRE